MSPASTAERARIRLAALRQRILRLRGTGPNPFDYWIWADETRAVLAAIFGDGSAEENAFSEIVGTRGRTADQRGQADNMTLGLHGEWGIWARLDRSEVLLNQILSKMES